MGTAKNEIRQTEEGKTIGVSIEINKVGMRKQSRQHIAPNQNSTIINIL